MCYYIYLFTLRVAGLLDSKINMTKCSFMYPQDINRSVFLDSKITMTKCSFMYPRDINRSVCFPSHRRIIVVIDVKGSNLKNGHGCYLNKMDMYLEVSKEYAYAWWQAPVVESTNGVCKGDIPFPQREAVSHQ